MKEDFYKRTLAKLENPSRVIVLINDAFDCIKSAENTNDTMDWFHVNSAKLEMDLEKEGLSWCYVFEKIQKHLPCIYMFIGHGLTKDDVVSIINSIIKEKNLPEGLEYFYETIPYLCIDEDKYDDTKTEIEELLIQKSSNVFKIYEP